MEGLAWAACAALAAVVIAVVWHGMRRDQQRFDALPPEQQNEEWERDVW